MKLRPILSPDAMTLPWSPFGRRRMGLAFSPASLFAASEPGAWLDPSDLSTLYQDAAGTTPVTAAGQSVGLLLDKSGRGNHATQATAAAMPTYGVEPLGGRRNLLTYTEQFDNAAWAKNATATANAAVAPDGATTAQRLVPDTTADFHLASQSSTLTGQHVISVYGKPSGYDKLAISVQFGGAATFDLTLGTVVSGGAAASIQSVGNGWFRCSYSVNRAGVTNIEIGAARQGDGGWAGWAANGTDGILVWGAQLETGSTATNYQRVGSAFDVTEAGVPSLSYLSCDGVDDWFVTPTITPGIDKAQVFAGVRKLSDATVQSLYEMSANANFNNGCFNAAPGYAGFGSSTGPYWSVGSKGTAIVAATSAPSFPAPQTAVQTHLSDIGSDMLTLRVNGTQVAQSTADQGTGNFLAYPLYIGRRGGTELPFNGRIYGLIVRFGANLTADQITQTETWMNSKTGAF